MGSGTNRRARMMLGSRINRRAGTKTKAIPGQGSKDGKVNKSRTVRRELQKTPPKERLRA